MLCSLKLLRRAHNVFVCVFGVPRLNLSDWQTVPSELYGPLMVVLTMIALLHYQMKSANHKVVSFCTW